MRKYFLCLTFSIAILTLFADLTPAYAKPTPTTQPSKSVPKTVDLKLAIEQFFKAGTVEESWFAPKEPKIPDSFGKFRQQALDSRSLILKLYGAYQSVRRESSNSYVVTFQRNELGIQFKLDSQGRIADISAK